ncbi:hypothetical protein TSUD_395310 [Trifolium subterraneum]|uniref:Reverse transcriptase zinc-binding domain-containing protein n=1 Tax=Trifolium subterraneum TaxID=3900 RepID=A0A2Z6P125_TRISU|nr:hypothetical protein TSUD_395310 [Trifolium subterraneum]
MSLLPAPNPYFEIGENPYPNPVNSGFPRQSGEIPWKCKRTGLLSTSQVSATTDDTKKLIWHSQVPLKVSIFAWRLLRDRLPTKANLVTCGILPQAAGLCVSGCGAVKSAQHLFASCSTFGSIWVLLRSWIGITAADPISLRDHFVQFTFSVGGSRAHRSFLQLIWLTCVWVIWTERNHRLFRDSASSSQQLLDKIKFFSFRWLKSTNATLASNPP